MVVVPGFFFAWKISHVSDKKKIVLSTGSDGESLKTVSRHELFVRRGEVRNQSDRCVQGKGYI